MGHFLPCNITTTYLIICKNVENERGCKQTTNFILTITMQYYKLPLGVHDNIAIKTKKNKTLVKLMKELDDNQI